MRTTYVYKLSKKESNSDERLSNAKTFALASGPFKLAVDGNDLMTAIDSMLLRHCQRRVADQ